jgi:hypothetical protein
MASPDELSNPRCYRAPQLARLLSRGWQGIIEDLVDPVLNHCGAGVGIMLYHPFGLNHDQPKMRDNFAQAIDCAASEALRFIVSTFVPAWSAVHAPKFCYIGHPQDNQRSPILQARALRHFQAIRAVVGLDNSAPEGIDSPSAQLRLRCAHGQLAVEALPSRPVGMHWLETHTAAGTWLPSVGVIALWTTWQKMMKRPDKWARLNEITGPKTAIIRDRVGEPTDPLEQFDQAATAQSLGMVPALDLLPLIAEGADLEPLLFGHAATGAD